MAAFIKYVTFDCAHPRRLSAFWSEVTGYVPLTQRDDFAALAAPNERASEESCSGKSRSPRRRRAACILISLRGSLRLRSSDLSVWVPRWSNSEKATERAGP